MELKTNSEWLEWGRRDPLFGVANWANRNLQGATPWTDEEFYTLGASDWHDFEVHWRQYGYVARSFVEIGCGAGRITNQLSLAFERGHAIDVSEDMIRYAAAHVRTQNIQWQVTKGLSIPLADSSVDAAFSCHVFQHLPSCEAGYEYFREIMRVLTPSGSLMIHLPIHMYPVAVSQKFSAFCDLLYRKFLRPILAVKSDYRRFRMKRGGTPPMHGTSFEQLELHRTLVQIGFERVEFTTFPLASSSVLHSFILATKPKNNS
jgi:ubiquinone/menaquinone biosynthesis C-methylase UbiE